MLPRTDTQVMLSGIKWTQNPNWSSVFMFSDAKTHIQAPVCDFQASLTLKRLEALARLDVPDLHSGVCVTRDQDVVLELHAAGEGLVSR